MEAERSSDSTWSRRFAEILLFLKSVVRINEIDH